MLIDNGLMDEILPPARVDNNSYMVRSADRHSSAAIAFDDDKGNGRRKRQLMQLSTDKNDSNFSVGRLWSADSPITYTVDDTRLNSQTKRLIQLAAEFWTLNTCISWAETSQRPLLQFIQGQGCYAEGIGRLMGSVQSLITPHKLRELQNR